MNQEIRNTLIAIVTEASPLFTRGDFEKPFAEAGLDSLAQVNVRVAIEKAFGRRTSHKEWFSFKSFADVCRFLEDSVEK